MKLQFRNREKDLKIVKYFMKRLAKKSREKGLIYPILNIKKYGVEKKR
jgi:hypothetical protein